MLDESIRTDMSYNEGEKESISRDYDFGDTHHVSLRVLYMTELLYSVPGWPRIKFMEPRLVGSCLCSIREWGRGGEMQLGTFLQGAAIGWWHKIYS